MWIAEQVRDEGARGSPSQVPRETPQVSPMASCSCPTILQGYTLIVKRRIRPGTLPGRSNILAKYLVQYLIQMVVVGKAPHLLGASLKVSLGSG